MYTDKLSALVDTKNRKKKKKTLLKIELESKKKTSNQNKEREITGRRREAEEKIREGSQRQLSATTGAAECICLPFPWVSTLKACRRNRLRGYPISRRDLSNSEIFAVRGRLRQQECVYALLPSSKSR